MSLAKLVLDGLKPKECKRLCLQEPLPVPYVPKKDEVQQEVSKMKNLQIKTSIDKDTTLNFFVWYDNGTKEAFLMHVTAVLNVIKKRGHFKDYKEAQKAYVEQKEAVKSAKAGLAFLDRASEGLGKSSKKSKKAKEAEAKSKEADGATEVPKDPMKANFQAKFEKAKKAAKDAKGAMNTAASQMFLFYANLFFVKGKYAWNKIVVKQTESNPYVNLQGVSQEGPRGMSRELFDNCVVFHLLTVFPINAAEQEKYYIMNVLKKPQRVKVRQFVYQVEQLNVFIAQMLCFYYSPNTNASTKLENIPFTEAELGSHVLRVCPIQWQHQYNMNKKGMTPMDMCLLLTSL
jgi:hypothetical protein